MTEPVKDRFQYCGFCGQKLPPREGTALYRCACGMETYDNPIPVAVGLIPVRQLPMIPKFPTGLLLVKRAIEPFKGLWALPGGFMERGESWQRALTREIFEETGIQFADIDHRLFDVGFGETKIRTVTLVFGETLWIEAASVEQLKTNSEVSEFRIATEPEELAFPTHTEAMKKFFARQGSS